MPTIDQLIRTKRRTLRIEIDQSARLIIRAPHRLPLEYIRRFLRQKENWIKKKQQIMEERAKRPVEEVDARPEESIFERIRYYSNLTGLVPERVRLSNAKTRWGSCYKNNIRLSRRLCLLPPEVADYVIVHELVHLEIKNHSRQFWQRVGAICPRYRELRRFLKSL